MGLALEDFWKLTPLEFTAARNAHYRSQQAKSKEAWEHAAWIAFKTVCPPKGRNHSINDYLPPHLQDGKTKAPKPQTRAEQEADFRAMAAKFGGKGKKVKAEKTEAEGSSR